MDLPVRSGAELGEFVHDTMVLELAPAQRVSPMLVAEQPESQVRVILATTKSFKVQTCCREIVLPRGK